MGNGSHSFERAALLDKMLKRKGSIVSARPPLSPREPGLHSPLSFAQQRIWFFEQLEPGTAIYHLPSLDRLRGALDLVILERSLNEIVRRHEGLRTTFPSVDGQPVQWVSAPSAIPFTVLDLSSLPAERRDRAAKDAVTEENRRPFDLSRGPLLRATVLRLAADDHLLLLVVHHIVFDGWSSGILWNELTALYTAFSQGQSSPLPELAIQYPDFATWQRSWLVGKPLEGQLGYWKERLAGALPRLEVPSDLPRPATPSYRGGSAERVLSGSVFQGLQLLSRGEGATQFMVMLAAFELLLHRHTGQEDLVIGAPVANRNQREIEPVIGFFVNTLVLRTDLSGNPTFRELLSRVRGASLGGYDHQDLPFDKLVEELNPDRTPGENPLVDVLVNHYVNDAQGVAFAGITRLPQPPPDEESKFKLSVHLLLEGDQLRVVWVYREDIFSATQIDVLMDQYVHLVEQAVQDPGKLIGDYSLVTPSARAVLPDPTQAFDEPRHEPIPAQVAAVAARYPDVPALRFGGKELSYAQFAQRIDQLAHALLARGASRGGTVAILGPRSAGQVIAMAAVLRAGGVLLTVDPKYPPERQSLMLREAVATHVVYVGNRRPEDAWLDQSKLPVLELELEGTVGPGEDLTLAGKPLPDLSPDDSAYVFFTSGTTGVPKAVRGLHKGLSHFVDWQRETFAIGPGDRSAQLTGLSFDVLLRDVFTPLASGATLCLPEEEELSPETLGWLDREGITLLHSVPSLLQSWLTSPAHTVTLARLRWIFSAGEPLTQTLVRRWRKAFPGPGGIANFYGPTETSLAKFCYRVPNDPLPGAQPVGRPLPQTQGLVLNRAGQLCGVGEPGDVAIRTPFRTAGYANSLEETRRRFVQNPFRSQLGDLLYLTGDRGRYRPDGLLELLGRNDDQVKIRGIRIEPAELEAALLGHPDVRAAAVVAREDSPGDKRLVAYLVPAEGAGVSLTEVRAFLSQRLPEHLVPSAIVVISALPLTPNGKLDRKALPAPSAAPAASALDRSPRTEDEEVLVALWAQVLDATEVGVHDSFFALGGHSLLAIRMVARIREIFRVNFGVRDLFAAPTVAGVARRMKVLGRLGRGEQPPLAIRPPGELLRASFSQETTWRNVQLSPTSPHFNCLLAWRFRGPLDVAVLERSINEIIRRHDSLRTTFECVGEALMARIAPHLGCSLPVVDLESRADGEATFQRLVTEDCQRLFDLPSRAPPYRSTLYRLAGDHHLFTAIFHHIICDGSSLGLFSEELGELYPAFAAGRASPLSELPFQFTDFAHWQRTYLDAAALELRLTAWRKRLAGCPNLKLPTDRPRLATGALSARQQSFRLTDELALGLEEVSLRQASTQFITLLAVFAVLLRHLTQQQDLFMGAWASTRRAEVERVFGMFITLSPLRIDASGDPTFAELLARVRDTVLEANDDREVPTWQAIPSGLETSLTLNNAFEGVSLNTRWGPELTAEKVVPDTGHRGLRTDLQWTADFSDAGTQVSLVYSSLFDEATIARWLGQYRALAALCFAQPESPLSVLLDRLTASP